MTDSKSATATDFADIDDDAINASIDAAELKPMLPRGFSYRRDGLYFVEEGSDAPALRISDRIDVLAQTRDNLSASWGLWLAWNDSDGRPHRWAMPRLLLAGDGNEIRSNLLDRGCYVGPSLKARGKLLEFFASVKIDVRARAVEGVGWHDNAFALPDRTIGDTPANRVIYQGPSAFEHNYRTAGDLRQWQERVARFGAGNSRLALALASAFVGPLLSIIGEEGGGAHFRGGSSTGKSTALGAAASAWGPPAYVRQWRATSNGLEGVCVLHNETLLCLDEIGQLDPKEAGSIAYMIANGSGKARAGRNGTLRSSAAWRVMFLSSGEIGLAELAGRDGRGRVRSAAGQEVRILDIEADAKAGYGMFETLHDAPSAEALARAIKDGTTQCYGVAGPAFVEYITGNLNAVEKSLREGILAFARCVVPSGANGQVERAARRFGLIAGAGELATKAGILPWEVGEADRAATTMFNVWLAGRGGSGAAEDREAYATVRGFLEAHGSSRFEAIARDKNAPDQRIINRAGFWDSVCGDREYLILHEAWKNEVCAGLDPARVARALADRNMLKVDSAGKYSIPRTLPGLGKVRVYIVTANIFGGDDV